jgi:L-amino acid N-acyltransferase YncA
MGDHSVVAANAIIVREAIVKDMSAVAGIYRHEVLNGVATFEEVAPTREELDGRRRAIVSAGLPYLVAELDGQVVGYSYASPYRSRPAYKYSVENTVYVHRSLRRRGVAASLLKALMAHCEMAGRRQMVAVIAVTGKHEESASIALHASLGFRLIGTVEGAGFKLGRWVDTVLMQRPLGGGNTSCPDVEV